MFFKKNWSYILMTVCFSVPLFLFFFGEFAMLHTTETCAKVTQEIVIKGHHSFELVYYVKGEKTFGKVSSRALKIIELKKLKKYDCIKIKHSNSFPTYIEIIDKRLRAGDGW